MVRFCSLAVLITLIGVAHPAAGAPPAPGVYTDEPPKEVKELIDLLKQGEVRVIKLLSERDEAAPYLRLELKAVAGGINLRRQRHLTEALAPIEARIYQRNKKRFDEWVERGRFDLCNELLVTCPEKKDAFELADLTFPLRQQIAKPFIKVVDPFGPAYTGVRELFWWPVFKSNFKGEDHAGADLKLPPLTAVNGHALIRADRCVTQVYLRHSLFVAVRSELRAEMVKKPGLTNDSDGEWYRSIVLVNNSTKLTDATESLIVCDGDVELTRDVRSCVVIANGNISKKKQGWSSGNYFAATGDISIPVTDAKGVRKCVFHAGGTVTLAEKPKPSDQVREKQKSLPFGVRFLDPEEFGLVVAAQNGGVQVKEIVKDSPFALYGVERGDVITSIDAVKATSVPDFRRQLRRGLLAKSVVLHIRRDNLNITRVVFLDGIPLPTAPSPREVKRPSP